MPAPGSLAARARQAPGARRSPAVWVAVALIAFAVALAAGVFIGMVSDHGDDAASVGAPAGDSVDVGFTRDMRDHHAQAVEMSVLVREATDDQQVRQLALDIMLTQQQQLGQMFGWLAAWGQPQAGSGEAMTWMTSDPSTNAGDEMAGMEHQATDDGPTAMSEDEPRMPGMATDDQLRELAEATGTRAERIYLQLMIPHHEAGVAMAEYALGRVTEPYVEGLAESIVASQTAELEVLRSMLEARGGPLSS